MCGHTAKSETRKEARLHHQGARLNLSGSPFPHLFNGKQRFLTTWARGSGQKPWLLPLDAPQSCSLSQPTAVLTPRHGETPTRSHSKHQPPSKGTAHFHIPSPGPENTHPGGHLCSCVTHGARDCVPSPGCTANTHPKDTSKLPQGTGRCGSTPSPSPCPPPSSAHPIPPSQSRSEPHCAGGPPHTSRVLPRSDLMAMSPELPQDRHMLSIIH